MLLAQQQQQRRQHRTTSTSRATTTPSSGSSVWWCCTALAVLKWLEVLFAIVIVAVLAPILCISPGYYDYIMFAAAFCLAVTAITMIIYFLRLHVGALSALPWRPVELCFNVLAALLYAAAFGIGVYHCIKLFQEAYYEMASNQACSYIFIKDLQFCEEWRGRVAAITAFSILNIVLHIISAIYARGVLM